MLWFNGVEAAVSVNDVELPRYQTTFDTPNDTVTCWVPSEAGKAFSVSWSSGLRYHSTNTSARLWIDGVAGDGMISPACSCRDAFHVKTIDRVTVSPTTAHLTLFSCANYADDQSLTDLEELCQDLGEIVLTIHEVIVNGPTAFYNRGGSNIRGRLREGKKIMTHQIQLGEEITIPRQSRSWCDAQDIRLVATFIFKYRPLEFLIAETIAPANLYTGKADDEDSGAEDEVQLQVIRKSIALLDKKFAKKNHLPIHYTKTDRRPQNNSIHQRNADDGYDSDLEYDEAKWHAMHNTVNMLTRKLAMTGKASTKEVKLAQPPQAEH